MDEDNHQAPGLSTLLGRISHTSVGLIRNRAELLSVEWQEEKGRLMQLLVWSLGLLFLSLLAIGLITATVVALMPEDYFIWAIAGFAILYLAGAVWAGIRVKSLLKKEPFSESIDQIRKDTTWLERDE